MPAAAELIVGAAWLWRSSTSQTWRGAFSQDFFYQDYMPPKDRSVPHRGGGGEQPSRRMSGGAMPSGVKAIGWRTS